MGAPGGRARSREPASDDLSRRRTGRPGGERRRERGAVDRSGPGRRQPPLHRSFAGRRRGDVPREAARRPYLSRGPDERPGVGHPRGGVGPPASCRPGCPARPGDFDCRHPEGVSARAAARSDPGHPGRDGRWPPAAVAARDPGGVPRQGPGPGCPRDLAGAQRQQPGGHAGLLHRDGESAWHGVRAEGHGHGQAGRHGDAGAGAHRRALRARPRRPEAGHPGARHTVHQESGQVHHDAGRDKPRHLPLQLPGCLRPAAACRGNTAWRVGQPDDTAARARERPLPVGDRAGVCGHDVRRGTAGQLPAEDELPDRHPLRPVAEVGSARDGGRPVQCRSDPGAARTRTHRLRLQPPGRGDPDRLLELGEGFHQRVPARPVRHAREGRHLRHPGHADLGALLHAAQDPRGPARLLRGRRQPQGPGDCPGHGRLDLRTAAGPPGRNPHQYVEPLHCRRVRRHERGDGAAVEAHA